MFKLSKYELRKNRNILLILLAVLAALEIVFLVVLFRTKVSNLNVLAEDLEGFDMLMISILMLCFYAVICYFAVYMFAIANYYREINSKTSYLVFMTPVSCLKIVLSKMLTVFVIGAIFAVIIGALGQLDCMLVAKRFPDFVSLSDTIAGVMSDVGFSPAQIGGWVLYSVAVVVLMFFSVVAIIYLCITLSATLFHSNGLKVLISIVFFFVIMYVRGKIEKLVDGSYSAHFDGNIVTAMLDLWPYALLNLAVIIICVAVTTWLLKKKLTL